MRSMFVARRAARRAAPPTAIRNAGGTRVGKGIEHGLTVDRSFFIRRVNPNAPSFREQSHIAPGIIQIQCSLLRDSNENSLSSGDAPCIGTSSYQNFSPEGSACGRHGERYYSTAKVTGT